MRHPDPLGTDRCDMVALMFEGVPCSGFSLERLLDHVLRQDPAEPKRDHDHPVQPACRKR